MQLYGYFRSTAAYRVRIALNLKAVAYENAAVHLLRDGGQQKTPAYRALNPQGLVPTLVLDDKSVLTQSLAIIEYLEETYPTPALLPRDALPRAHVRAIAQSIACDIHPLNNLRVLQYLKGPLQQSDDEKMSWYFHWLKEGFTALEQQLQASDAQNFCVGDSPTLADLCLIPQLYNAERFDFPLQDYPTLQRINQHCLTLPAFYEASPSRQPDAIA